jgi:hypothetical protein
MVRHGEDHVHIVTSRVSETGEVWHARQDFRNAQRAATQLEKDYGLQQAPREKTARSPKVSRGRENERFRGQEKSLTGKREEQQKLTEQVRARARLTSPEPGKISSKAPAQEVSAAERVRRAREQAARDRDRDRGR